MSRNPATLFLFLPEGPPGSLFRLCAGLPGSTLTPIRLEVPLTDLAPEEVCSLCLSLGVTARATTIVTRQPPG